jgi:DNA-binding protein HU-beta
VNKAQLIEALSERLGDKKAAGAAVDGLVDVIVRTVNKGEKVNITGFGVFEKRARAARTARNPRTGETVKVKKTSVPAFRAGASFKDQVASGRVPKAASAAKKTAAKKATAAPSGATATKTAAPAKTAAKKAPAKKAAVKTTRAAAAPVRKTATAKAAPVSAPARKAPARKAAAR